MLTSRWSKVLLQFPIIGCFFTGALMLYSPSSILQRNAGTENFWPGTPQAKVVCTYCVESFSWCRCINSSMSSALMAMLWFVSCSFESPGITYLLAGCLYILAALLGYMLAHFHIRNQRDKGIKRFGVVLFIFFMLVTVFVVGKHHFDLRPCRLYLCLNSRLV